MPIKSINFDCKCYDTKTGKEICLNPYPNLFELSGHSIPVIKRVIFHDPATIIYWKDGDKTVVKCGTDDVFDPEKGLTMAIAKKVLGKEFHSTLKRWISED